VFYRVKSRASAIFSQEYYDPNLTNWSKQFHLALEAFKKIWQSSYFFTIIPRGPLAVYENGIVNPVQLKSL